MSTRAVYTFADGQEEHHVYKHSDGYPSGALDAVRQALDFSWPLPRFEPDEFAAGFVAANKAYGAGGVRLMPSGRAIEVAPGDIAYRYEVRCMDGELYVKAFSTDYWNETRTEVELFSGTLDDFATFVARDEAA